MPYCWHCGKRTQTTDITCAACGKQQPVAQPNSDAPAPKSDGKEVLPSPQNPAQATDLPALVPLTRVIVMSVLCAGVYLFYWMYLTWKHYRDHTKEQVYPAWHALATLVPLYGFFRTHAHIRAFKVLLDKSGSPNSLSPMLTVVVVVLLNLLGAVLFNVSVDTATFTPRTEFTRQEAMTILVISSIASIMVAAILANIQADLNKYWASLKNVTVTKARFGPVDIVLAVFGVWTWLTTISLFAGAPTP